MAERKDKMKVDFMSFQSRVGFDNVKTTCPQCGKKKSFRKFVDVTTGMSFGDEYGICDRAVKCGYMKSVTADVLKGKTLHVSANIVQEKFKPKPFTNTINPSYVLETMNGFKDNFSQYLFNTFAKDKVYDALLRYKVGSTIEWNDNATIFWQIDAEQSVRTGKIMLYDKKTGKRVKKPFNHINWIHSPYRNNDYSDNVDFNLVQCFFGEHLANEKTDTFNFVESEKTAIIASIIRPESYWIATGGLKNIKEDKLEPFAGKKLVFFPDKGKAFFEWKNKLDNYSSEYNIVVDDFLEKQDIVEEGEDMADYLIKKFGNKNK